MNVRLCPVGPDTDPVFLLHLLFVLMSSADRLKDEEHLLEERMILEEMLEVVEKRDALASLLEDQRLQDSQADQEHEEALMTEDLAFCWS